MSKLVTENNRHMTTIMFFVVLVAVLALTTLDAWTGGHTELVPVTYTPKLYFALGAERDTSNSYIVLFKANDPDTTYIHPDHIFNTIEGDETLGVWGFNSVESCAYGMIDTIGPDSVIAYPIGRYVVGIAVGDSAVADSTAFAHQVVPSYALRDSIVKGKHIKARVLVSKHIALSTLTGDNIATGSVPGFDIVSWSITGTQIDTMEIDTIHMATGAATKRIIGTNAVGPDELEAGAINNVNKATANLWNSSALDETDDYTFSGAFGITGNLTISDTIFVTGLAAWQTVDLFIHPDGVVVNDTPDRYMEFWDIVAGTNAYGYAAYATGGVVSDVMSPFFTDNKHYDHIYITPSNFNPDSAIYIEITYITANTNTNHTIDWDFEYEFYDLYEQSGVGDPLVVAFLTGGVTDPTTVTIPHASYGDYCFITQTGGTIAAGWLSEMDPKDPLEIRLTCQLGGVGPTPLALNSIKLRHAITHIFPN